ncbi:hypothetical protein MKX03_005720 [Papaver bracteatum]|nr:hypothetical protein MKX03_005720 [Papaver bracteatum]
MATSFPLISAGSVISARSLRGGDKPSWPAVPSTRSFFRPFNGKLNRTPKLAQELRQAVKVTSVAGSVISARFLRGGDKPSWPAVPSTNDDAWGVFRPFNGEPNRTPKLAQELRPAVVANSDAEAKRCELEILKQREDLEVTDDIVSSDAKLHALYLKWLSYYDHHFDVEDEKAFMERFKIFKNRARRINQWNKGGHPSTCGLNQFSDMTDNEYGSFSWKTYPKKPNQVIAGIAHYLDN